MISSRPLWLAAGLAIGLLLCSLHGNSYVTKRDRIKVVHDTAMGCDYISINGGPFFPRLNSIGLPACDYPSYIQEMIDE